MGARGEVGWYEAEDEVDLACGSEMKHSITML